MGVGLDPELTKWSVRSGPVIVLTKEGYKEYHWLVIPPSTTLVISYITNLTQCLPPSVPFLVLLTILGLVKPLSVFMVRLVLVPIKAAPSPPLCTMKRNIV